MPVVALDTAAAVGEIKDVLVDPTRSRVIGFTLRGQGLLSSPLVGLLLGEHVHAIGHDALMIPSESAVLRERQGMDAALGEQQEVVGKEVVTQAGSSLGTVSDVVLEIDGPLAEVVGYEIEPRSGAPLIMPAPHGVPLSGDTLVMPEEAEDQAANGLVGFREVLERSRVTQSPAGA